jgi:hypothetical protein
LFRELFNSVPCVARELAFNQAESAQAKSQAAKEERNLVVVSSVSAATATTLQARSWGHQGEAGRMQGSQPLRLVAQEGYETVQPLYRAPAGGGRAALGSFVAACAFPEQASFRLRRCSRCLAESALL